MSLVSTRLERESQTSRAVSRRISARLSPAYAIAIVFLCALALRLWGLTFDSLWLDEAYQTMVDAFGIKFTSLDSAPTQKLLISLGQPQSISTVLNNFRQVDPLCPPLYPIALNRWMLLFGTGDFAVRSLSVFFSMISLAVLYLGTRKLFNSRVALAVLLLAAVSPYDITYGQEARMYSLVTLCATASCFSFWFLIRSVEESRRLPIKMLWLLAYAGSSFALINSHYTGAFLLAFHGLFGIGYCLKRRNAKLFAWMVGGWFLFLLAWMPWFGMFMQAASIKDNFYVSREASLLWPLKGLSRIPINWLSFLCGGRVALFAAPAYVTAGLLVTIGVALSSSVILAGWKRKSPSRKADGKASQPKRVRRNNTGTVPARPGRLSARLARLWERLRLTVQEPSFPTNYPFTFFASDINYRRKLIFVLCWALVPAAVALVLDLTGNRKTIEVSRYLISTAPAVYILAGIAALKLLRLGQTGRLLVCCHVLFVLVNYAYAHTVPQREPWREMAKIVEQRVAPDDMLLVSPHYDIVCLNRYLETPRMQVGTGPLLGNQHVYNLLTGKTRCWLLTAQEGATVSVFIPPRMKSKETIQLSHSLMLTRYEE